MQTGDTVVIHFLNRVSFPVTLISSGMNGTLTDGSQIAAPGQLLTWEWSVPDEVCSRYP